MNSAVCVDVGSTYTKSAKIDLSGAELISRAEVPTTSGTDVLEGLTAAVAAVDGAGAPLYVCSSAGGGLRLAVVGYESLVTAEAGHRVGLSAGAQVVHVAAGPLTGAAVAALRAARPDVVLLVGGTDGGDGEVLLHNARRLAANRLRIPVVLAGNVEVRAEAARLLRERGVPVTETGNVLPRIGVLDPLPARAAIRAVFLRHVIGGKRLSRGNRFASMVRYATPDAVLAGVELLADRAAGGVLVVDVGGATTDVYSALVPDAELETGPRRDVAGTLWRARTVEGDLGVAVGAAGTREAAVAEKLPEPAGDRELAATAARIALRRHARGHSAGPGQPRTGGRDLRDVRLVVGSGGVLRHGGGDHVLDAVLHDTAGGWALPDRARTVIDKEYVLAAAGLLATDHPAVSGALLQTLL
ncbi:glutamate mutase [Actinoplanes sp. SE50]|uniref:glutamate mutase L n=1 Tax=unclassified Actinoplanes TaxID=2626549 RepID=UPI00023EC939|nr:MULTISPECIES: glutamate mutase L [unclassified Actinoplanes]AEV83695.1 methylaspartate mutase [Actinoplanes sp. SE50/110]ATO82161.1 glutamate mutase [Actinoplanes sp. SE50]SLL99568.1 glutamate mutase [Actinoplanes sp. SE50/110]